ncbi:ankyrin repeat domain-containing protein 50 isoform X2 [Biomphalaria glabrata]|nr:ankyrin repeat domain-containing protein 50 isoform X2 [Biomphalaria glabrata]
MDISECTLKEDRYTFHTPAKTFSPFWYALMIDNLQLARYFSNISFLTLSDCCYQQYVSSRNLLVKKRYKQCLEFVDELFSKPMSLEKLSLVTVCSLIGPGGTREVKIKGLQLPVKFKDQLLFRTEDTLRTVANEERHVTMAFPLIRIDFLSDSDSDD